MFKGLIKISNEAPAPKLKEKKPEPKRVKVGAVVRLLNEVEQYSDRTYRVERMIKTFGRVQIRCRTTNRVWEVERRYVLIA